MTCKRVIAACCCAAALATCADTVYTSASYVQDGLIAQWDGIDNQGTGAHDPTATTWKDLKGSNDLTIAGGLHAEGRNAEWRRGICLYFDNVKLGKAAAYGAAAATTYKTIEVVYKRTSFLGRILFWGGTQTRYVVFDQAALNPSGVKEQFDKAYFDGTKSTKYVTAHCYDPTSLVATYDGNNTVADIYYDGAEKVTDLLTNPWSPGDNRVTLGFRSVDTAGANYGWAGEVYAIRLYSRALTAEEIARNHAIDVRRFFTSAMYDKTGMVSFWDAKDNVGEGRHDSTTNTWKNLVAGGQDLTLNNSSWGDGALVCNGSTKSGAYGTETLTYKSLDVLFRSEYASLDDSSNSANVWLFSNGINRYCVLGRWRTQWQNWSGIQAPYDMSFCRSHGGMHLLSWFTPNDSGDGAGAFLDGVRQDRYYYYTSKPSGNQSGGGSNGLDDWGAGGAFVQVGGRSNGSQNFKGRIYSVRAYENSLDKEIVWQNTKIDMLRYANALKWIGGDGSFGTVGNWRDVDAATSVPGLDNTVDLTVSGTYKITLDQNVTIGAMRARNGHLSYVSGLDATIDMGGKSLTVMGGYQAEASNGFNDRRFARLNLTNGTFKAESVLLGSISDRIADDRATWLNYGQSFTIGSGSFCVDGANTTGSVRKVVQLEGSHTKLRVAGGATFSCGKLRVYSNQSRHSSYPSGVYDRAVVEFTGAGTTARLNGLWATRDADITVGDGAAVTITGCAEYFSAAGSWISSIGRSFDTYCGNSSRMVVDNATLTMTFMENSSTMYFQGFAVGASYKGRGGSGTSVTVQNGGTLAATGTGRFFVGVANSGYDCRDCALNVLDGATFDGAGTRIEVGTASGDASFGRINVSNATVNCKAIYLGPYSDTSFSSSNHVLSVAGAASSISLASTDAYSLKLRMGSQLKFTLPEDGFASTPITTAGGVAVYADEDSTAVDPVKLVVDASAFKGNRQTLVETATDSTAALQKLVDNVEFVGKRGLLSVADGGTKLVFEVPGVFIILR